MHKLVLRLPPPPKNTHSRFISIRLWHFRYWHFPSIPLCSYCAVAIAIATLPCKGHIGYKDIMTIGYSHAARRRPAQYCVLFVFVVFATLSDFGSVADQKAHYFYQHRPRQEVVTCQISFREGRYDVMPPTCWKKLQNHPHCNLTRLSLFHPCGPPPSSALLPSTTRSLPTRLAINQGTPTKRSSGFSPYLLSFQHATAILHQLQCHIPPSYPFVNLLLYAIQQVPPHCPAVSPVGKTLPAT